MEEKRRKLTDDEKKTRRREQKKLVSRKLREKMKQDPGAWEQKRKRDREYYLKKKSKGLTKSIKDLNVKDQKKLRKKWREDARKRRERKKLERSTELLIEERTPPSTRIYIPRDSSVTTEYSLYPHPPSTRPSSDKSIAARSRRSLKSENIYLRQRLEELEKKLTKFMIRDNRTN